MYRRSRFRHTLSSRPWAERQNLVYGFSVVLTRRQAGTVNPFIPIAGFILKSRNRPFEQIRRNQHHRGKVLFTVPFAFLHSVRQQKVLPGRMIFPILPPGKADHKARLVVISLPYRLGDSIFRCRQDSDPHLRLRMETVVAVRAFQKELYNTFFR